MKIETTGTAGPVVGLTARFRVPKERLFDAWTQPESIEKWFFAEAGYRTHDVELTLAPLGSYRIVVSPDDDAEPTIIRGNFIEIIPGVRLAYTWSGTSPDGEYWTLVSADFGDAPDGGSEIELVHGVFRSDVHRALHEQGWLACFSGLQKLLEGGA